MIKIELWGNQEGSHEVFKQSSGINCLCGNNILKNSECFFFIITVTIIWHHRFTSLWVLMLKPQIQLHSCSQVCDAGGKKKELFSPFGLPKRQLVLKVIWVGRKAPLFVSFTNAAESFLQALMFFKERSFALPGSCLCHQV